MNARTLLVPALMVSSALLAACNEPTRYDSANFSDSSSISKTAGNYWKREGWWAGVPKDVRKIAITQFAVEYVTENVQKSGADALSVLGVMEMGGMGRRQRQFDESFKQQFPSKLYDGFVTALKAEGFDVVPAQELQQNPAFATLKTGQAGGTYNQSGRDFLGRADNSSSVKLQVYPAAGLPLVDDGWFNAGTNAQAEGRLVGDTGAQAGLRVRIRVALDDDGHAILDKGSTIHVQYAPQKQEWQKGNPQWVLTQRGAVTSSGAFRDDVAAVDAKEFKMFKGDIYTVNTPKFEDSILKMYPTFARMAASRLRS